MHNGEGVLEPAINVFVLEMSPFRLLDK